MYEFVEYYYDSINRIIAFEFFIEKCTNDSFKLGKNRPNRYRSSMGETLLKRNGEIPLYNLIGGHKKSWSL